LVRISARAFTAAASRQIWRINVGKKVTEGQVEVVSRSTRKSQDANIPDIETQFKQLVHA
jgi:hypothetical protein